ncbi:PIR Superfamily Protein [Plasmodium ovale curtisi]|uniref:PIR Superfamily Protein n=1 Tax=Plasmodium ovale curtisi TaxID=864141 RepID=A0A1A8WG28_PLAOA|nr:PIR Superfamily Protein [Plasmodium ovale curtisi]
MTKRSKYLKYLFYNIVIFNKLYYNVVRKLLNLRNYNDGKFKCLIHINKDIDSSIYCKFHKLKLEDIIRIKLLLYYLANYDVTENKRNISEIICKRKHELLLTYIITNYNQLHMCNNVFPEFCNEFDECKRICGEDKLSTYHCNENQVSSFSVRSSDVA